MRMLSKNKFVAYFILTIIITPLMRNISSLENKSTNKNYPQKNEQVLLHKVFASHSNVTTKNTGVKANNIRNYEPLNRFPELFRNVGNPGKLSIPHGLRKIKSSREWTFMVYLDADNNLEDCGIDDFLEMSSIGSTSDVAIVALFDRASGYNYSYGDWRDARIFYITSGMEPSPENAEECWGEVNMGDPQTLVNFVSYVVSSYPANHYALVLWDHGGGLDGVCWDETGDNLNLFEIRNALETIYSGLGIEIDVIGFDACLMGMMEVAYQLRDYVNYVVFSEETEPGDGWPYDDILADLISDPLMSPSELAVKMAQRYIESYDYGSQGYYSEATQSAVNITHLGVYVFRKFDRLVGELLRYYGKYSSAIDQAVGQAETFYLGQKDIVDFLNELKSRITDEAVCSLIEDTVTAINSAILYSGHLSGHPDAHGLSIYIARSYSWSYSDILMSQHHQWDEFLRKYNYYNLECWVYDVWIEGSDRDHDGYLEFARFVIDVDSDYDRAFRLVVKGISDIGEYIFLQQVIRVSGAVYNDTKKIWLRYVPLASIYSFSIEIWRDNEKIMELYYYFDDDVSEVMLEPPPYVEIIEPNNETYIPENSITVKWKFNGSTTLDHFEVSIDNNPWINKGSETYHVLTDLSDGTHNVSVRAYDNLGYIINSTVIFTVDTQAPYLELLSPPNNSIICINNIELRWEGYDNIAVDRYLLEIDEHEYIEVKNASEYTLHLGNGVHTIWITIFDKAGNYRKYRYVFIVDGEPPNITITHPRDNYMVGTVIRVTWKASDDVTGINFVKICRNGTIVATFISDKNYTDNIILKNLEYGKTYIIDVIAYDKAGNHNSDRIKVKVVPFEFKVIYPKNNSIFNHSWIMISWKSSRNSTKITIYINNSIRWKQNNFTPNANLTNIDEGKWLIKIIAEDDDGYTSQAIIIVIIDLSKPKITIEEPKNNTLKISSKIEVKWRITDLTKIKLTMIRIDYSQWINTTNTNSYIFRNINNGKHIIEIMATDSAGHTSITKIVINVNKDLIIIFIDLAIIIVAVAIVTIEKIKRKKKQQSP